MESLEEKLIKHSSSSEDELNIEEKEAEKLKSAEKKLDNAREKLGKICYSINSYREIDENLIGRYGLDEITEKCHFLNELLKADSSAFLKKGEDLQHYIGNFEGGLSMLPHLEKSTEKEERLGKSFRNKILEFNRFLDLQIQSGHSKKTAIH